MSSSAAGAASAQNKKALVQTYRVLIKALKEADSKVGRQKDKAREFRRLQLKSKINEDDIDYTVGPLEGLRSGMLKKWLNSLEQAKANAKQESTRGSRQFGQADIDLSREIEIKRLLRMEVRDDKRISILREDAPDSEITYNTMATSLLRSWLAPTYSFLWNTRFGLSLTSDDVDEVINKNHVDWFDQLSTGRKWLADESVGLQGDSGTRSNSDRARVALQRLAQEQEPVMVPLELSEYLSRELGWHAHLPAATNANVLTRACSATVELGAMTTRQLARYSM
ncbi:hypothetical protein OIO90_006530 [Microbotryomycetes sp. JL221]|nr:hypothetical protein OIO90_006530 [Microbotryomycetes sp. JL221]